MPRKYERKTDRVSITLAELVKVKEVEELGWKGDEDLQDDHKKIYGKEKKQEKFEYVEIKQKYENSDVQSDDDDGDKGLSADDFVIVKFTGKKSTYNYVGLVENVVGDEISARFLKKSSKRSADGKPIFTFRENDEGVIPRGDVLKKLPTPQKLGGTARREHKFTFPSGIQKCPVGRELQWHNLPQRILSIGTSYPTLGVSCATKPLFFLKLYFLNSLFKMQSDCSQGCTTF